MTVKQNRNQAHIVFIDVNICRRWFVVILYVAGKQQME